MANKGLEVEKRVKEILEKELGKSLTKQKIIIGKIKKEFDLVSDDKEVVVEVKVNHS